MHKNNYNAQKGLWQSTFISMAGLLLIVVLSFIIEKTVAASFSRNLMTIVSVIFAVIPPLLWLTIFYRQDRLNPEPKGFVFKILLLGALVQKAFYTPIVALAVPNGNTTLSAITRNYILTVIIVGIVQESSKLLAVRYSVYTSREFDEKVDGIIYGSAMGLGFAAMTSIDSIISSGGAMLTNATCLVVIETLAHASITGLSCYILGASKQKKFNIFRLPLALLLAAALNSTTQLLLDSVTRKGLKVNYIIGLIPAALVALLVFVVLVFISSKGEKENLNTENPEPKKALLGIIPVWAMLVITLIFGFLVNHAYQDTQTITVANQIDMQYPSNWIKLSGGNNIFKAGNMIKGDGKEFVSVKKLPINSIIAVETKNQEEILQNAAASWSIKAGMNYRFYQPEQGYFLDSKGKETYIIDYVYIDSNQTNLGEKSKPSIGYGRDILSIVENDIYIITVSTSYEKYVLNNSILNEIKYAFR